MDEIGKLLPALFEKQIGRTEPHLLEILNPLWPRIAGKPMAQHSQPALFASGVLTLHTDCAAWDKQLRYMGEEIRAKINGFLGQPIVKKVRIRTITQPGLFSPPRDAQGTARPAPPVAEKGMNTDCIADPEVALALASSYAKYFSRPRR
jgi:hypothetical protein